MGKVINISVDYNIGDRVYLITDSDQQIRVVTGVLLRPGKIVMYELSCCEDVSYHFSFEIDNNKSII